MVFEWKVKGLYKVPAQAAGEELERIRDERGSLTPGDVVAESEDSRAVLHGCFEWDDTKAAVKYRDQQARVLIGNLVTVSVNNVATSAPTRAFIHIQDDYKPVEHVVQVKDYADEMLQTAMNELRTFETKYRVLNELAHVFDAIDEVAEKVGGAKCSAT